MANPNVKPVANAQSQTAVAHENSDTAKNSGVEVVISKPPAGENYEVSIAPGEEYVYNFARADIQSFAQEGDDLTIHFTDDSSVTLKHYMSATNDEDPAKITYTDALLEQEFSTLFKMAQIPHQEQLVEAEPQTQVRNEDQQNADQPQEGDANQIIENVMEAGPESIAVAQVAERLAEIEPAAGEGGAGGASGHGYGFQSSFDPQGVIPINDVGPINPTALQYGVDFRNDEVSPGARTPTPPANVIPTANSVVENVDESNLDGGPLNETGQVVVDFGADGPGTICADGNFTAGGSMTGGTLSSGGFSVLVTSTANGYTGTANGQVVFTLTIDPNTGEYVYTQYLPFDHADGTNPNDIISLHFGICAEDADGDTVTTTITINVADDAPVLDDSSNNVDETDLGPIVVGGDLNPDFGADGQGEVYGTDTFTAAGSMAGGTLTSGGNAVVVTFDSNTNTYTGTANGQTVFTLSINADGTYEFTLLGPLDHADPNDPNDIITLHFGAQIVDSDGDTDNAVITINIADDGPTIHGGDDPDVGSGVENVDETDLGPVVVGGQLNTDFGNDGPGSIGGNGNFTADGSMAGGTLTSCGHPVIVTFDANTGTYTGTANGQAVFTLVVNGDGSYEFTLLGPLDHADPNNPNDIISLHFGVTASDADGDTSNGQIVINVADDAPSIDDSTGSVDESNLGPIVVGGDLNPDFGADGEGAVNGSDDFTASGSMAGGALTSGGHAVVVTFDSNTNTYTGTANGQPIFTLSINADGTYEFTLLGALDHADPNDPNDIITLHFGAVITDCDGDTANATISIDILDSVPVIGTGDDPTVGHGLENVDETDLGPIVVGGAVDIDFGADGPGGFGGNGNFTASGSMTGGTLTSCGHPVIVTFDANTGTYTGTANGQAVFTLAVNNDGTYEFTLLGPLDHADPNNPNDVITLHFGVTATDADGDTSNGQVIINVADDAPSIDDSTGMVDESDLGPIVVGGDLNPDFGADGEGAVNGSDDFTASGSMAGGTLTSGGHPVIVTFDANTGTYTGTANGQAVFTLSINTDGTYEFTLLGALDHADPNNPDDIITLHFGAVITDCDGDTDNATISINVLDSGPVIGNPDIGSGEEVVDETNLGPVIVNGALDVQFGADGPGEVNGNGNFTASGSMTGGTLTSGGHPVIVTFDANTGTYTGTANGQAVFTLNVNGDGTYNFTLLGTLDHANTTNPDDVIDLHFGVSATDADGDSANGQITVHVHDDGPSISGQAVGFNEDSMDNGAPQSVSGDLTEDFGADGPGDISPNGTFMALFQMGGQSQVLTSGGVEISVTQTANGYVGTAGGQTVFSLTVDPLTGQFTYTQYLGIDHPGIGQTGVNDTIWLKFGITITDGDGDTATTFIQIDVRDGGPSVGTPTIGAGEENVDETNIDNPDADPGVVSVNGQLDINFGADGPGDVGGNGNFTASGSMTGGTLTSHGQPVIVTYNANTGTYTGTAGIGGQAIFTLSIDADGSYTFNLFGPLDHADGNNPNDIIDLHFGVTATDGDGDSVSSQIIIHVADDGPSISNNGAHGVNESALDNGPVVVHGDLTEDFGADGSGSIHPDGTVMVLFQVGGQNQTLYSHGVPVVITQTANGYVGTAGGQTVFSLTINSSTGQYTYTQFKPVDHPGQGQTGTNDTIWIKLGVEVTDADGDTATTFIQIDIRDDGPVISATGGSVDETGLGPAKFVAVSGTLNIDFGADGPGQAGGNGNFTASGSMTGGTLTSHGQAVIVSYNANTGTYTGTAGIGGKTVFTLAINPDGTYQFKLFGPLDHANGNNPNDIINLHFGVSATDGDGDTVVSSVTINVADDGPSISNNGAHGVNESALDNGPVVVHGDLTEDFGADGSGSIHSNGTVMVLYQVGGQNQTLYSHGVPVVITQTANGYVGTAGGQTVFSLTINSSTGQYTYTQFKPVDHPGQGQTGTNDTIWIKLGVEITDADGDTATTFIQIDLRDDGPVAVSDSREVTGNSVSGNVLANDDFGVDGPGWLNSIKFGNQTIAIANGQTKIIHGQYGVLQISSNGNYTYTKYNGADGTDVFTYGIKDYDGDAASANLTLHVDNPAQVHVSVNNNVDDVIIKEDGYKWINITVNAEGGDANDYLVLTLNGFKNGWTGQLPPGWAWTGVEGQFTITLPPGQTYYSANFKAAPPPNSDADLYNLNVTAQYFDPSTGTSVASADYFNVIVDAVVDAPVLTVQGHQSYSWHKDFAYDVPLSIASNVTDTDGSEKILKIIIDLNQPFTNGAGGFHTLADLGVTLNKGIEVSPGIWEIAVNSGNAAAALSGLQMHIPAGGDAWWPIHQINVGGHAANIKVTSVVKEVNLSGVEVDYSDNQTQVIQNISLTFYITPLVLDLDGDGIELLNQDYGVMFDMNNNGTLDQTSWVASDDAFLAIDLNGDGVINNQNELFGSSMDHADGFANLASYDSNYDGVIDAQDALFANLIVWQDVNQDGISQADEMFSLTDMGIVAINLGATLADYMVGDSWISEQSTFVYANGQQNVIADAWFNVLEGDDIGVGATLEGGDVGVDIIYGTGNNDVIIGNGGNDILHGGGGDDIFVFKSLDDGIDVIKDFSLGDKVDLSQLLTGFNPGTDDIHNYVFTTVVDGNTVISVDVMGSGDSANATVIAILQGVTDISLEDITGYHPLSTDVIASPVVLQDELPVIAHPVIELVDQDAGTDKPVTIGTYEIALPIDQDEVVVKPFAASPDREKTEGDGDTGDETGVLSIDLFLKKHDVLDVDVKNYHDLKPNAPGVIHLGDVVDATWATNSDTLQAAIDDFVVNTARNDNTASKPLIGQPYETPPIINLPPAEVHDKHDQSAII
jgi:T1SS-143 domain-containing protein